MLEQEIGCTGTPTVPMTRRKSTLNMRDSERETAIVWATLSRRAVRTSAGTALSVTESVTISFPHFLYLLFCIGRVKISVVNDTIRSRYTSFVFRYINTENPHTGHTIHRLRKLIF
ncbi:uncharacterized protein LOC111694363 [Trichogramma pretiosum]|uniref:uncharacterized protein LOC111694363 n=1 Tax=Trichogramma pretiosum TaxID=7493 RepID=UPI000C71977E|nr:uncharacterized protein LOC111694363 [Trichogramma pretiosum]